MLYRFFRDNSTLDVADDAGVERSLVKAGATSDATQGLAQFRDFMLK